MEKKFYLLLLSALPISSFAQPVITTAGDYNIGLARKMYNCSGVAAGSAGANQTWNFASLSSSVTDSTTYRYMAPPAGSPFTSANLVEADSEGTYIYFNKTSTGSYYLANVDSSSTPPTIIDYSANSILYMQRPLTYGLNITDTFTDHYTISPISAIGGGTLNLMVDGYGTLITPAGTYPNVVRVRLDQHQMDSSTIAGYTSDIHEITYLWFDNNHKSPLMQVDSFSANTTITGAFSDQTSEYLVAEDPLGVNDIAKTNLNFNAVINSNTLLLNGAFEPVRAYNVDIYSNIGQNIYHAGFTGHQGMQQFDLNREMLPGMYLVQLRAVDNPRISGVIKIVKQ